MFDVQRGECKHCRGLILRYRFRRSVAEEVPYVSSWYHDKNLTSFCTGMASSPTSAEPGRIYGDWEAVDTAPRDFRTLAADATADGSPEEPLVDLS